MAFNMLFVSENYTAPWVWVVLANACFVAVPFVRKRDFLSNRLAWGVAAVAGAMQEKTFYFTEGLENSAPLVKKLFGDVKVEKGSLEL